MNEQRLLRSVRRLASALGKLERQTAAGSNVSVSQLRLLLHLNEQPAESGLRVSDIALEQGLAISTMTRNLSLLEKRGWLQRKTDSEDKRSVRVLLTDEGRSRSRGLQTNSAGSFSRAFQAFHPSDRLERAVALDRVAAALEKVAQ